MELPAPDGWPAPPDPAAYHGLAGAIVERLAPNTEADPVAILTQLLIACGAMLGHQAFFQVEATLHHPNEFVLLVGDTAKARKGSSFDHVARLLADAHPGFPSRVTTGLSSGEGLIWAVRDPQDQDPGAHDKRLLVVEPEFASVLKATSREISTLSPTLRSAWDGRPLALLTRTAPATATQAHVAIIGHITQTELARHTTTVESGRGCIRIDGSGRLLCFGRVSGRFVRTALRLSRSTSFIVCVPRSVTERGGTTCSSVLAKPHKNHPVARSLTLYAAVRKLSAPPNRKAPNHDA